MKKNKFKWVEINGVRYQHQEYNNTVFYAFEWRFIHSEANGDLYITHVDKKRYLDKVPKEYKTVTIEFDDWAQDFLEWDIDLKTGEIVGCRPFQASVWCGHYVADPDKIVVGDYVHVSVLSLPIVDNESEMITIKYKIIKAIKK